MGVAASHMGPSAVLPPPTIMKDFYPPRGTVGSIQHHRLHQQQQIYQGPARSNSRSTSPPLPPGAASPRPMNLVSLNGNGKQHPSQGQVRTQIQTQTQQPPQRPQPHLQQPSQARPYPNHPNQFPQPQPQLVQPLRPRPPTQYQHQAPPQSQSSQQSQLLSTPSAGLHNTPSLQQASLPPALMRGKPRIFAAMEAQEATEVGGGGGFGNEQAAPYRRQSQYVAPTQSMHQPPPQPPQQLRPSFNQPNQPYMQSQPQPAPQLLPPIEFFTPKSRIEPLPNEFIPEIPSEDDVPSFTPQTRPQAPSPPRVAPAGQDQQLSDPAFTPRSTPPRSLPRKNSSSLAEAGQPLAQPQPQPPPPPQMPSTPSTPTAHRARKLSKARNPADVGNHHHNESSVTVQSSLDLPQQQHRVHRSTSKPLPSPMSPPPPHASQPEHIVQLDEETIRKAGIPLDDDPFARVEGVKMLKATTPPPSRGEGGGSAKRSKAKGSLKGPSSTSVDSVSGAEDSAASVEVVSGVNDGVNGSQVQHDGQLARPQAENGGPTPLTPVSPEEYRQSRKDKKSTKGKTKEIPPPTAVQDAVAQIHSEAQPRTEPYTLVQFLSDPHFLSILLSFFSFYDWCILSAISKQTRIMLVRTPELREVVLESYLKTVGYSRWIWNDQEPLSLSLQDLNDYMRGVSIPTHEYARVSGMYVHSLSVHPNHRDPSLGDTLQAMKASTRAYTRVILRLRAQAEKEASLHSQGHSPQGPTPPPPPPSKSGVFSPARPGTASRVSSRAPSPTTSLYSHSHSAHGHVYGQISGTPGSIQPTSSQTSFTFRSPLFRLRRAPLLRVFVPSPEGDWLSDKSVLECEAECKRAGVQHLLRLGDVVWDVAVGDEGNVGRLVWDGSYLLDLDYTYSTVGDLPKYLPTLAFPPSYFHRVIRTGANLSNPIAHIDISPWGEEIAMNLQLLQDRVRTETPQGAYHNVVRWVHRSSFTVRPSRGTQRYPNGTRGPSSSGRIPIHDSNNLFVDSGWHGIIVVETEGTNEALADLQDRCGPGAFPPRPRGMNGQVNQAQVENRKVFRILRERSRPGEIWIKAVSVKERLL
ncbi:hypothetical protein CPB84DRAFT_1020541 [Gymnopilus junonius]|uniref:Uncharacterized protein n=1 Tax=Gymnopilus junonius TaxID=109634 RepID=A0A9P5TN35_GYMJU|nr:hypothetical protein CPB84DRAFT_1020541 [Gymnopilus junonius]